MTLKYILVGYDLEKTEVFPKVFDSLKEANIKANAKIKCDWNHFTIVPVAIPDEDDLSLM